MVEAAGLAIEIARLRVELRRRLAEVEASRARIVAAGYEERRRIERDLHDGAQQRLVSIGLALRHAQHELGPTTATRRDARRAPSPSSARAIEELRELARGVRPAQLDAGLAPALRELARRAAAAGRGRRRPTSASSAGVEAAAYFVACEGLTNAVKHAHASRGRRSAPQRQQRHARRLRHATTAWAARARPRAPAWAGSPTASPRYGGRAARSTSRAGRGTTLVAELPCGS